MGCCGLFVTGTDTGVGKTFVASAVVRQLRQQGIRVGAYKPVVSGSEAGPDGPLWQDIELLSAALGGEFPKEAICPQRWHAAVAPSVAARMEGSVVDAALLRDGAEWWRTRVDLLVVEGAGGLLSPITDHESVADLAADLGFPLLVVARLSLGTINHTLLTLEAAHARNLKVAGIFLNQATPPDSSDRSAETNAAELARRITVPILGVIPWQNVEKKKQTPLAKIADDPSIPGLLQDAAFPKIDFVGLAAGRA